MSHPYIDFLYEQLEDPEEALAYLNAALVEGEENFLLALTDVCKIYLGK